MSSVDKNTLPEGWEEKKLNEYLSIQNGFAFNSKKFNDNGKGTPLIRIRNLKNSNITTYYDGDYDDKFIITKGDFLIGMDGEFRCYEWNNENSLLNQRVCKITDVNKNLDSRFLFYGINKFLIDIEAVTAFVTVKHISARQIKDINFPIPTLEEQKRIVAKIDTLFTKIDKATSLTEESLKQAENLLPSILKEVFEKGKADGWEEKKLGEILEIDRGGSPRPIKDYLTENENGLNWIKIGDATNSISEKYIYETKQKIKPEGLYKTRLVKEGDFILSNSMSFGKPYIMKTEGCIHDGWLSLKISDSSCLETDFLYYVLSSPIIYNKFRFLSAGTTVKNLNKAIVASVSISFPHLKKQKEIVLMLDAVSNHSKEIQSKLEGQLVYLKKLKSSILSKAFKGKL